MTMGAQVFVAPRRSVTANHINLGSGVAQGGDKVVEQIEDARIVRLHIAGAVVPQIMIELCEGLGIVGVAVTIDDIETFSGVGVKEMQAI